MFFLLFIAAMGTPAQEAPVGTDQAQLDNEISFYLKKTADAPSDALHFAYLAEAYIRKARMTGEADWYDRAHKAATTSHRLNPFDPSARTALATIAHARHKFDEARHLLDDVLADHPSDAGALGASIIVHLAQGSVTAAGHDAELLLAALPQSPGALTYSALVLESQGRDAEADYQYREALRRLESDLAPASEAWTRSLYGRFLFRKGRTAEAREMYSKALRTLPGYHLGLFWLARLEIAEGNYREAADYLTQAFSLFPAPIYLFEKSRAMRSAGDQNGADQTRDQAARMMRSQLDADSTSHRVDLARVLLDKGAPEDIRMALLLLRDETTVRRDHETLFALATALYRNDERTEARRVLQEIFRTGIRIADYYHLAGLIERGESDPDRARSYFELALATNPEFEPAARDPNDARKPRWSKTVRLAVTVATIMSLLIFVMYLRSRRAREL